MKILQVTPAFAPSNFGGIKNVSYNLSKALAKRGDQVTVFTTDANLGNLRLKKSAYLQNVNGVEVRYFRNISNLLAWKCHLFLPIGMIWAIKKEIVNFDIIHLHEYRSFLSIFIRIYAKKNGIPFILQAHGSVLPIFEKYNLKKLYDFVWGFNSLRDASKMIAVSKVEKDQYLKMGVPESKIKIIPNGIDESEFERLPRRGKFRNKYRITSNEKIILYLGRLNKRKGINFLIDGFLILLDQNKNVKLVIIGSDDGFLKILNKKLDKLTIENNILIIGYVSNEEKIEAFVDADVLVYPGVLEIFGLVPLEAIMSGTAVIVADDCGCGEIIKEADCGYLVKYGDINDLKVKMLQILSDDVLSNQFIKNGQNFIKNKLYWAHIIEDVKKLYLECISLCQ